MQGQKPPVLSPAALTVTVPLNLGQAIILRTAVSPGDWRTELYLKVQSQETIG